MSDSPYLSLIANLNSGSPVMSSPEEYSPDLSLWTNAEFTFDVPPGLGIFENDSGFEALSSMNHPAHVLPAESFSVAAPLAPEPKQHVVDHNPQSVLDQQHLMEYLNLPNEESRPESRLSLLERTRQRNPVKADGAPHQLKPQLQPQLHQPSAVIQEQAAAINAFHSLLAAYSASQVQQQQQLQQPQSVQVQKQQTYQRPQSSPSLPLLLPNIAPATAPTTPAAAKLLRPNMSQYKPAPIAAKKAKAPRAIAEKPSPPTTPIIAPALVSSIVVAPKSPTTSNANAIAAAAIAASSAKAATAAKAKTLAAAASKKASSSSSLSSAEDKEMTDVSEELSPADLFSKDDPDYLSKVAAEEDKRRRNTAASARFRFKKKLREQALEQTAKEQTEKADTLQARVKELEMEVKWLRGLIVEKDVRPLEVTPGTEEQSSAKRIKLDVY
ncbi:hypothetical protein BG004_005313 [Podila humilis]|nr:hypothetical protein BG004_005313 [Podila humilis]